MDCQRLTQAQERSLLLRSQCRQQPAGGPVAPPVCRSALRAAVAHGDATRTAPPLHTHLAVISQVGAHQAGAAACGERPLLLQQPCAVLVAAWGAAARLASFRQAGTHGCKQTPRLRVG